MTQSESFSFFSVETGSFLFSIVNLVISVLSLISATVYYYIFFPGMFGTEWIILSMISILFAVLLVHGIIKRKPEYIKQYFVYGVVMNFLFGVATIGLLVYGYQEPLVSAISFLSIFLHSLILMMIYKTHKKFSVEKKLRDQPFIINLQKEQEASRYGDEDWSSVYNACQVPKDVEANAVRIY